MDDLFTRIYEWAQPYLVTTGEVLSSPLAQRIYAVAAIILALWISIRIALSQYRWVKQLGLGYFEKVFRGPKPERKQKIEQQLLQAKEFKRRQLFKGFGRLGLLVFFGLILPSAILITVLLNYSWFGFENNLFVRADDESIAVGSPTPIEVFVYALSQLTHGVLLDTMEVFRADFSAIQHDRHNVGAGLIVLGYRSFVGIYTAAITLFLYKAVQAARNSSNRVAELEAASIELAGK